MTLLHGRRGTYKTFSATILAGIMEARYRKYGGGEAKVFSNYNCAFARYRSQYIVDEIIKFPPWATKMLLVVDEIQTLASSRMAMTRHVRAWSDFLTMIRKRGVDIIATTQFPQDIDQRTLRQIDLVVEPRTEWRKPHGLKIWWHIVDYWGSWTPRRRKLSMPPFPEDATWTIPTFIPMRDLYALYAAYDDREVIASMSLDKDARANVIEYETEGKGRAHHLPGFDDLLATEDTTESNPALASELSQVELSVENKLRQDLTDRPARFQFTAVAEDWRRTFGFTKADVLSWLDHLGYRRELIRNRYIVVPVDDGKLIVR